ncbi:MAG TPA: DUF5666 domain-containing protein [Anaeromyxobacter sp.]|nr:DUF5666 domain-containing protein [Anaeromyxobacter sp.]
MRKLAIVGALAALAWAQGVRAEDTEKAKAEAQEKVQKAEAKAAEETHEAQADAQKKTAEAQKEMREEKAEASEKVQDAREDEARHAPGTATGATATGATASRGEKKHPMFEGKDNFEVKGRIESVSASAITVRREELPSAKLRVDRNTKIELDGQHVSASQLKQGQEVKASFNLQDDKPMAVEIKAEKLNK